MNCFFVSDLHGRIERYRKLWQTMRIERPDALFLGGDLLPHPMAPVPGVSDTGDFLSDILVPGFGELRRDLAAAYPRVFLIPGNDDPRSREPLLAEAAAEGLWETVHDRRVEFGAFSVIGYAHVPPTPFLLKDWERYDVSRFVDPGCLSPEEGRRTTDVDPRRIRHATIAEDLQRLADDTDPSREIWLFHTPPYGCDLDRAALDGRMVDHVPVDVHVGSIAVQRFIGDRQPRLTLHGHVHEAARLTGSWRQRFGRTHAFNAAHDGPELALVRFDPQDPDTARREILTTSRETPNR